LSNLAALDLDDNGLEDIGPIASLTNLTSLGLSYDKFLPEDLDLVLASLVNLVELNLTGNHLTELGNITTLANLERLYLGDNQLSDISGLKNCTKLVYLDLHKNKITDVSALAELENLEFVDLFDNDVSDFTPLAAVVTVYRETDTDGDNMLDDWERNYFGGLSHNGMSDTDKDGLTDLQEYQAGTNPTNTDTDADGMPDGWEVAHGLNALSDDAQGDPDGDGLSNLAEYRSGTDPNSFTVVEEEPPVELPEEAVVAEVEETKPKAPAAPAGDSGGGGGGCFIESAAWGSFTGEDK
jgi:Leucine-rich repeat (LRR) protein